MRAYNDFDEEVELFERLIDNIRLTDGNVMEHYDEYCEMMQWDESVEYRLDAENHELARQWDE